MKKILIFIFSCIVFFACRKPAYDYEVIMEKPVLTSSIEDSIELTQVLEKDPALSLNWTGGTNYGTNSSISYSLKVTKKGNSSVAKNLMLGKGVFSKGYSFGELNSFLVDSMQLAINEWAAIEIRLLSTILSEPIQYDSSNLVLLTIKPYKYVAPAPSAAYSELWVVGDATPVGWNITTPAPMAKDPSNIYQFKYNEVLKAGQFKIPTKTGDWQCDYYMPPTNDPGLASTAVKLIPKGEPDNKWVVTTPGPYKITLNISSSPSITILPFTPYNNIYIVGDATSAVWDINNAIAMTKDPGNPYLFTWTGSLTSSVGEGAFKFPLEKGNWGGDFFMAPGSEAALSSTQIVFAKGGTAFPDNKFKVKAGQDGTYKITINQLAETISIVKQ